MRVFLDANILFSAANPVWHTRKLVEWLIVNAEAVSNPYAAEEARRNLAASFPQHVEHLEKLLGRIALIDAIMAKVGVTLKEKDVPILGGAIAAQATHLLTGDQKDFGHLFGKTVQGVRIVTQRMLVEELRAKGIL